MTLSDQIRADRDAGTPGPWSVHNCTSYVDRGTTFYQEVWNDETDILVTTEVTRAHNDGGKANMRRIARVPELEEIALAAEELVRADQAANDGLSDLGGYEEREDRVEVAFSRLRKVLEQVK